MYYRLQYMRHSYMLVYCYNFTSHKHTGYSLYSCTAVPSFTDTRHDIGTHNVTATVLLLWYSTHAPSIMLAWATWGVLSLSRHTTNCF